MINYGIIENYMGAMFDSFKDEDFFPQIEQSRQKVEKIEQREIDPLNWYLQTFNYLKNPKNIEELSDYFNQEKINKELLILQTSIKDITSLRKNLSEKF